MAYGSIKVDNIIFTNGGSDQTITVSGIVASTSGNLTVTGTISGGTVKGTYGSFTSLTGVTTSGTTANFTNVNAQNIGVTTSLSGLAITGGTAGFTTVTGTTVTGTTANFVSGVFSTRISGVTITGTTVAATTGSFTSLTGTTTTGTTANFVTVSSTTVTGTTANFVTVSGTTVTGNTGSFQTITGNTVGFFTVTGTTVTGTTANFVSGVFTTKISGLVITGNTAGFTTITGTTITGNTANFATVSVNTVTADTAVFVTSVSGLVVTGNTAGFTTVTGTTVTGTTANFVTLSGTTITGGTINVTTTNITSGIFAAGSAAAPSIAFTGDLNTGFWSPSADAIAASTGGSERLRIDSSGRLLVGTSSTRGNFFNAGGIDHLLQLETSNYYAQSLVSNGGTTAAGAAILTLARSRGTTAGSYTAVSSGDSLGRISFQGAEGVYFIGAAEISAEVDGTPNEDDMPGRLVFSTTADGAASPTEAFRITNDRVIAYNQPTPTSKSAAATLTITELKTGIIQYTGAVATLTLPTGTLMEGGFAGIYTNMAFEWSVINTGSGICTVAAGADHTVVGSGAVATSASARFVSRRTAANTFVSYRVS